MKPLYKEDDFNKSKNNDKLPCECYECKKTFYVTKKEIILKNKNYFKEGYKDYKNRIKFCGNYCRAKSQKKRIQICCSNCDKIIEKKPGTMKKNKSGNFFCSKSCATTYNNKNKKKGIRRSKLEIWLESKLTNLYPNQKILFNEKEYINSELDIHFVNINLAFELNGIFHYEAIYGKDKLEKIKNNDKRKFQACLEKNIELCVIDSSNFKYFKEEGAKKYLKIIQEIVDEKIK